MDNRKVKGGAIARITAAMFIFGTIGIFVRHISLPSGAVAFVRGVMGTVFLLAVLMVKRRGLSFNAIKKNLPLLIASGVCIGINWILLFEAYRYTTVAVATVCYYLSPVFVIIASPFVLRERLTVKKVICVLCALLGVALVSGVFEAADGGIGDIRGILLGIGAAALYAAAVLLNKHTRDIDSYDMTVVQLSVAALAILPYTLLAESIDYSLVDIKTVVMLVIVGAIHTGLAYMLYFGAIKALPAQTAAIFSYVDPVVAIVLSAVLLSEKMTVFGFAGAVLVLLSTLLCELPATKKEK